MIGLTSALCVVLVAAGVGLMATPQSEAGAAGLTIVPNPSCESATFYVSIPHVLDSLELVAYDVTGRHVSTVFRHPGWHPPGDYLVGFSGKDIRGELLPPGYYLLMARSHGEILGTAIFVRTRCGWE